MSRNQADWLLDFLADQGVEVVFGNPGSTELPLIEALGRQTRIQYVLGLHEATVMGMADGYAQQGDRLAVVNVHVQPGLANAMSGILNAARARVPIVVTVGQQVTSLKDSAPFLGGELVGLAQPLAKGGWEVERPTDLGDVMSLAVGAAGAHPRGPVVVSLPMDVLAAAQSSEASWGVARTEAERDLSEIRRAGWLIGAAHTPVVLAGDGVVHEHAGARLAALAERIGAPIHGEPFAARYPLPAAHPLWRGPLPGFAADIRHILEAHDTVIAVGMPVFRLFGDSPGDALPAGIRLIHIDVDPKEIGRTHPPQVGIAGSVNESLQALLDQIGDPVSLSASGRRANLEQTIRIERTERRERVAAEATGAGVSPATFCQAIAAAVSDDDLIVDEALTAGRWLRTALGGRNTPENWLAHRGSALGWGLPAAVGAKLADPGRRVMCVHGDGSFLFGVHALWTAARERLGLAVVVADNSGYEILRAGMEGMTGEPAGPWPGLALVDPPIDLMAVASGFGATAARVERREDLPAALEELWIRAETGPAVLVVPVVGRTPAIGYPISTSPAG